MNIPNFGVVDDDLLRGGRPTGKADYDWLVSQQVGTIFNFEGDNQEAEEMLEAGASRFTFIHLPINSFEILLTGIPWKVFQNNLNLIDLCIRNAHVRRAGGIPGGYKVFAHCRKGKDRTGLHVAGYRVQRGMTGPDAYAEALKYGYDNTFNFGLNKLMDRIKAGEIP